jgi:hypothetical protein
MTARPEDAGTSRAPDWQARRPGQHRAIAGLPGVDARPRHRDHVADATPSGDRAPRHCGRAQRYRPPASPAEASGRSHGRSRAPGRASGGPGSRLSGAKEPPLRRRRPPRRPAPR